MRRIVFLLLFALCMPVVMVGAQTDEVTVVAEARAVNLRSGPGIDYPIIGTFYAGDAAPAIGRDLTKTWVVIDTDQMRGWVATWVVDVVGDVAQLPLHGAWGTPNTPAASAAVPDAVADTPAQAVSTGTGASFSITDLHYVENGRMARMWVNVTNHGLRPALSSGNWYPQRNPDGGRQWVTMLKAGFLSDGTPYPLAGNAPLWQLVMTLDDGTVFSAYAGCEYYETYVGKGFEPTADGGFAWEKVMEGGWFLCGGDWGAGNVKPENDLLPGDSASVPLNVWLLDPNAVSGARRIVRVDFIPHAPDGTSFGVVDSVVLEP